MDQVDRSDDASIPPFCRHGYRLKLLKPQHQFALLGIVQLHNVVEHVQRGCPNGDHQRACLITCENGCYTFPSAPSPEVRVYQIAFVDQADARHFAAKGFSRANKCQRTSSRRRLGRVVESNETANIYGSRGMIDTNMTLLY